MRSPLTTVFVAWCLLAMLAPTAAAQTRAVPIQGDYTEVYLITGRAIDDQGRPFAGAQVELRLEMDRVRAEPILATINCKGDFIATFTVRDIDPDGVVKARLIGDEDRVVAEASDALDPFFRRSDIRLDARETWGKVCENERENVWPILASFTGRVLDRVEPYEAGGLVYHAKPHQGVMRMRYQFPTGETVCPPHPTTVGSCEVFGTDERGDVRYSFTFDRPIEPGGRISIILEDNRTFNYTVADNRLAVGILETTGQGAPPIDRGLPAPPAWLALLVAALLLARRRRA